MALATAAQLPELLPALVITDKKSFETQRPVYEALGLDAERVEPVVVKEDHCAPRRIWDITNQECVDTWRRNDSVCMGTKQVGIAEAHRAAWQRVAHYNRSTLILEKDWTIGTNDASFVRSGLRDAFARPEDYVLAGSCWYFLCMHAYIVKPALAQRWATLPDMCSLVGPTPSSDCPIDWLPHYLQTQGHLSIYSVRGEQMPDCFGEGLIQQARWSDGVLDASALNTPNTMDPKQQHHDVVRLERLSAAARQAEAAQRLRAVEGSACARTAAALGWDYRRGPWTDAMRAQRTQFQSQATTLVPPGRQWQRAV